jgi:NAD(P)-dependent dehydrogenase (short-subunit alcohol dehydrogenase family)
MKEKKVALITGASAGIGMETAKLLYQHGYTVYGAARRIDRMTPLTALGIQALKMDVTDESSLTSGVAAIMEAEGRIDVLINNAGFGSYGALEDVPMADARYQLDVNLFGLARLTQLILPQMRRQKSGKIVNVSSIGGKLAMPFGGWYHASKFALEAYSDSLRLEVRPFGIDVVVIEPGGIQTEWGGIAFGSLEKVSGNTVYGDAVRGVLKAFGQRAQNKLSSPQVISRLILRAITVSHPRARYVAGYMAKPVLFFKHWLSDRGFDKMLMSMFRPIAAEPRPQPPAPANA